ncbi:DUF1684 domain-containing protein [candidate division KSB1 bacterium]|nr:DUF1684 domain-containing protein [candidate division KSB1 bacterium]
MGQSKHENRLTRRLLCFAVSIFLASLSCQACRREGRQLRQQHATEINEWHAKRVAALTGDQSWLTLAGLFWLQSGDNRVGGAAHNDIRFPGIDTPAEIGVIRLSADRLFFAAAPGVEVLHNGHPVQNLELQSDATGEPSLLELDSLLWIVIKRGDRYGVRLWDRDNPTRKKFAGIERFPVDLRWRLQAHFQPYDPPKTLAIASVIGTVDDQTCPGNLVFSIKGRQYTLDALAEAEDDRFFVIFADQTSGQETYGSGRFLLVDRPDSTGFTAIDFNKAYNPPCAFSPYATCPLPPPQNRLPIAVRAGEKYRSTDSSHP